MREGKMYSNHGLSKRPIYRVWQKLMNQYGYLSTPLICEEWFDVAQFFADVGEFHAGFMLERIDQTKPFMRGNFAWVPVKHHHWITFQNETMYLFQWARKLKVQPGTLQKRISKYGPENAIRFYLQRLENSQQIIRDKQ